MCLPFLYPSKGGRYSIPRKESRADLGSKGLIGKIRLTSDMLQEEIMAEIRSVFSDPMRNEREFPFSFLQRSGPGINALTIPAVSSSYSWSSKR